MESVMKDEAISNERRRIRSNQGRGKSNGRQKCQQTVAGTDVTIRGI